MRIAILNMALLLPAVVALAACDGRPEQQETTAPPNEQTAPATTVDAASDGTDAAKSGAMDTLIAAAVGDPKRPEGDVAQDGNRRPAEIMAFAGFEPGDVVADIGASGGYYTRIVSRIVGDDGHVFAFNAQAVADMFYKDGNPSDALADEYGNVSSVVGPFSTPVFDQPLDAVLIVKFYHDSHYERFAADTATMNRTFFEQLKPGGTYLVIDHAAAAGSGLDGVALHRIDGEQVKREVIAAGFELVAESDLLANPADDHTKSVFDPSVRGTTDRFVYKFRKPG